MGKLKYQIGDTIKFGNYGGEPIEFEVKDIINGNALLVSKNIIECGKFDEDTTNWNDCELRKWLNNEFYNTAFNDEEKAKIQTYSTTNDKVFLLSKDECEKYFPTEESRIKVLTKQASKSLDILLYKEIWDNEEDYATGETWFYWLRSAYSSDYVNSVHINGDFDQTDPYMIHYGLVPALIVKI